MFFRKALAVIALFYVSGVQCTAPAISARFEAAVKYVSSAPANPARPTSVADKLQLYGLFKQAKSGDAPADNGGFSIQERRKRAAWQALRGKSRDVAMQEYVALVQRVSGRNF
jgi:diazepam-binding inhibitor (GABA receptor modulating acyl-CoA-binding protein)